MTQTALAHQYTQQPTTVHTSQAELPLINMNMTWTKYKMNMKKNYKTEMNSSIVILGRPEPVFKTHLALTGRAAWDVAGQGW